MQQTRRPYREAIRQANEAFWLYEPHVKSTDPRELADKRLRMWRK